MQFDQPSPDNLRESLEFQVFIADTVDVLSDPKIEAAAALSTYAQRGEQATEHYQAELKRFAGSEESDSSGIPPFRPAFFKPGFRS